MTKKVSIKNIKNKPEVADDWVEKRELKKRLTIDIPVSLHTKLKIKAAKSGETMAEIVYQILDSNLKSD